MPNLAWVISRGVSGKLRTVSAPNCPKVYSIFETSRPPEENGITGFKVNGETAVSSLLKAPPLWSLLSNAGISVGMANVPATFPAPPVNGYLITGMLTHGEVTVAVANDKKPRRQDSRVPAVYLASAFVWIIPVLEFCKSVTYVVSILLRGSYQRCCSPALPGSVRKPPLAADTYWL